MSTYDLPPLAALRAFEAAARHASLTAAAAELFVTPSAISHQLRQLEGWLGFRVLERTPRSVSLTPSGVALYDAVVAGFTEVSRVVGQIRRRPTSPSLTLSATSGFLSLWLIPRLDELRRRLPKLELNLHAGDAPMPLGAGGVDVAIRYGAGPFAGLHATALCQDAFAPVCSPSLKLTRKSELRRVRLLHVVGRRAPKPSPTWARWCLRAGVEGIDTEAGLRFTDSAHALQAAVAGQGAAIVSLVLAADLLASGLLTQPFAEVLEGSTYHFVSAAPQAGQPEVVALREWFEDALSLQ
jgi:LysR family transcriptional regulator, glycine cleavage system transcriptional activator